MLKLKKKNFIILLVVVFFLGIGVTFGGIGVYKVVAGKTMAPTAEYDALKHFASEYKQLYEADQYISKNFLWDYNTDKIQTKICKTLVDSLGDNYSSYMTKKEYQEFQENLSGSFYGVGVTFIDENGKYIVRETVDGTPAQRAGLKKDDQLVKVDGKTYKNQDDMMNAIRGPKGSKVTIEYIRGGVTMHVTMVREEISVPSVNAEVMDGNIGYIRIKSFDENTGKDFESELRELEGKDVKGLIIDLRVNGGGYVKESIKVADLLLPACTVVSMQNKAGVKQSYDSDASCTDLPYVVLVDGGTASASEILAGAIQDNKGGKIVGTKTFGKGIVQTSYELKNGGAVKLTTMEYVTPNGHKVHKKGIKPDYIVKLKANDMTDYQLNKAKELLNKK